MTAINLAVQGKRAYLMADRAATRVDGSLTWIDSKIIAGQAFPFALAVTGHMNPHALTRHLNQRGPRNPRALLAAIADSMPVMIEDAKAEGVPNPQFCVQGIVWSARTKQPGAFVVSDGRWHQFPAFEPRYVTWAATEVDHPSKALGRPVDMDDPASFDPRTDGVALMEWQRRNITFDVMGTGRRVPAIGGGIELATIDRNGLTVEQIHTWPDEVGKPIVL